MRHIVSMLLLLALVACSSLPEKMVGRFDSPQDFIVVKKNAEVWWSPVPGAEDKLRFIGRAAYYSNEPGLVYVVTPSITDISPRLHYASDYSRLTVDWHMDSSANYRDRSTEFVKSGR